MSSLRHWIRATEQHPKYFSYVTHTSHQFDPAFLAAYANQINKTALIQQHTDEKNQLANALSSAETEKEFILWQAERDLLAAEDASRQTAERAYKTGKKEGASEGHPYSKAEGMAYGFAEGLKHAKKDENGLPMFEHPYVVYDLSKPSLTPIARGTDAYDISANISKNPDLADRALPWVRRTKPNKPESLKSQWNQMRDSPFTYDTHDKLIGFKLDSMFQDPTAPKTGIEVYKNPAMNDARSVRKSSTQLTAQDAIDLILKNEHVPAVSYPSAPVVVDSVVEPPTPEIANLPPIETVIPEITTLLIEPPPPVIDPEITNLPPIETVVPDNEAHLAEQAKNLAELIQQRTAQEDLKEQERVRRAEAQVRTEKETSQETPQEPPPKKRKSSKKKPSRSEDASVTEKVTAIEKQVKKEQRKRISADAKKTVDAKKAQPPSSPPSTQPTQLTLDPK